MSRLFLKFFFAFWLTILVIALTAGSIIWLREQANPARNHLDAHAEVFLSLIRKVAKNGDEADLKQLLIDLQDKAAPTIYALNAEYKDLLKRKVNDELLEQLNNNKQSLLNTKATLNVVTKEGTPFLLVAVEAEFYLLGPPDKSSSFDNQRSNKNVTNHKNNAHHKHTHLLSGGTARLITPVYWALIAILISIIFSALLSLYFIRPIRDLRKALADVSNGNLTTRLSKITGCRKDEFSELGANFDQMVEKLQALISAQQNLLKDVSHELRSPLARIQAIIGIAQQQPDKIESSFPRLELEINQMNELIGELLVLSQVDTVDNLYQKERVNLTDLLLEIVDDAAYEAIEKQIDFEFSPSKEISCNGYQKLLSRAIENVIRNAIKYSPEHGVISIQITDNLEQITLIIEDQGTGIIEADLSAVFEPFFQSEPTDNSGSGLGLAIAARAIKKHNGSIAAQNIDSGGLRITITLPH